MSDEAPDVQTTETPAQPDHGLYDLSGVPEELRSYVEPHLQNINKAADKKIREQAEALKRYEPIAQIDGLTDVDPEELQALLQFRDIASDPDQLSQWIQAVSQEMGLAPEMDEEAWARLGEENGWLEGDGGDDDPDSPAEMSLDDIVAAVKEALAPEIEPVKQSLQMREEQEAVAAIEAEMRQQMDAIKSEHGDLTPEQEEDIISLAGRYIEDDNPIAKGFEHYQRIRGNGASDVLDEKLGQKHATALNGGVTDTTPEPHTFDTAKTAARARFAQQR